MDNLKQTVLEIIQQSQTNGVFSSGATPSHTHNRVDSPAVSYSNLINTPIAGLVTLSSGRATIINGAIKSTSTIIVTSQNSVAQGATVYNIAGKCVKGSASIYEGSSTSSDTVNYLIII